MKNIIAICMLIGALCSCDKLAETLGVLRYITEDYVMLKDKIDGRDWYFVERKDGPESCQGVREIDFDGQFIYWTPGGEEKYQINVKTKEEKSVKQFPEHVKLQPVEKFWKSLKRKKENPSYSQNEDIVRQIEDKFHIGVCIYMGRIGPIMPVGRQNGGRGELLYIRRDDSSNSLYTNYKGVIAGADSKNLDETQILKIVAKDEDINVEYCNAIDYSSRDVYIIFTKKDIYILDFSRRHFFKYHRTMEQYREPREKKRDSIFVDICKTLRGSGIIK